MFCFKIVIYNSTDVFLLIIMPMTMVGQSGFNMFMRHIFMIVYFIKTGQKTMMEVQFVFNPLILVVTIMIPISQIVLSLRTQPGLLMVQQLGLQRTQSLLHMEVALKERALIHGFII